jgi:hypothetical protein
MLEPDERPLYSRPIASCNKGNGLGVAIDLVLHQLPEKYRDEEYVVWRINLPISAALELTGELLTAIKAATR